MLNTDLRCQIWKCSPTVQFGVLWWNGSVCVILLSTTILRSIYCKIWLWICLSISQSYCRRKATWRRYVSSLHLKILNEILYLTDREEISKPAMEMAFSLTSVLVQSKFANESGILLSANVLVGLVWISNTVMTHVFETKILVLVHSLSAIVKFWDEV